MINSQYKKDRRSIIYSEVTNLSKLLITCIVCDNTTSLDNFGFHYRLRSTKLTQVTEMFSSKRECMLGVPQ